MAIEIVDVPIKNGDLNHSYVSHYQRVDWRLVVAFPGRHRRSSGEEPVGSPAARRWTEAADDVFGWEIPAGESWVV